MFDGNIFYPYRNVLAYSDMFFVTGLWTYPIIQLTHNPGIVNGLAMAAGQLVTMLFMYWWWLKLSHNQWASMVGVMAFGLSQIRMEYQVHVQMWELQYTLIATWLIITWLEDKKNWKLYLGAGLLGLQVWESLLPVYFAGLVIAAKLISQGFNNTLSNPPLNSSRRLALRVRGGSKKGVILAVLMFGVIAAPPLMAYWGVGREFNYRRDIREAAHNSISINDIWGKFASPGLYILFAAAVWQIIKFQILNSKFQSELKTSPLLFPSPDSGEGLGEKSRYIGWLLVVLIASLIMALGPVVKWQGETVKMGGKIPIPLPYAAAYYLVPGWDALRTPSRWMWVAGWAGSGLIALGFMKYDLRFMDKKIWILLLIAVVGGTRITKVRKLPTFETMPGVYKWLARQPGKVVLEVPMGDENIEADRMVYSLYHGKKLVSGFSGFTPPGYYEMAKWVNDGLTWEEMSRLRQMGVDYIVTDKDKVISLK
jgi:hypothetical protein